MSRIVLIPSGGLANRMKAVSAAISLSQAAHAPLLIVWHRDWGLGCRFSDLFLPIDLPHVTVREATWIDRYTLDRPRLKNLYLPYLYGKALFSRVMYEREATRAMHRDFDFRRWSEGRRTMLNSCTYFLSRHIPGDAFRWFVPQPAVSRRIDAVTNLFRAPVVGVHIRRSDHTAAIEMSPTQAFVERMRQEPGNTIFYLATDSEAEKRQLREAFPGRVITSRDEAARGSVEGMQQALAELCILSRTSKVIGSYRSTFSETAAAMGHITCETIVKEKP